MTTHRFTTDLLNDPLFIGFDTMIDRLNTMTKPVGNSYPPYNIIKSDDDTYVVQLAVAGFTRDQLNITIQDSVLSIQGSCSEDEDTNNYIHRGIASRAFTRRFTLADTIEVVGADMENGMLSVQLKNVIPDAKKPRTIDIRGLPAEKELLTE